MNSTIRSKQLLLYRSPLDDPEWVSESCLVMSDSLWLHGINGPWYSPGQNTRGKSHSLLRGIFPIQESNQGLLHWRQILYQLSSQGSLISEGKWKNWCIIPFALSHPMSNGGNLHKKRKIKDKLFRKELCLTHIVINFFLQVYWTALILFSCSICF